MFTRGDRVRVEGYGGRAAVLLVWEDFGRGVALCSEEGYQRLLEGAEAPVVGFPRSDIKGLVADSDAGCAEAEQGDSQAITES
jgi:hypothetical protein